MTTSLRFATPQDIPAVLELIKDLALFEKAPQEVTLTVDEMVDDGFNKHLFKTIVATQKDKIVGMALFYPRYSTWKGRTIHLEDFIVHENFRGQGIGRLLFDAVVEEAKIFGAKRLEWMVLDWNENARKFYLKRGAELDGEWEIGKLREHQIIAHNSAQ